MGDKGNRRNTYRDLCALAAEMVIFLDQTMECQGTGDERKRDGSYRMANMTLAKKTVSVCSGFAVGDLPRSADKHLGNGLFSDFGCEFGKAENGQRGEAGRA